MPRRRARPTPWWEFVTAATGNITAMEAAERSGIDKSVFGRWRRGQGTTAEVAVRFARAFEVNVLQALVAAGVIDSAEAEVTVIAPPHATLLREVSGDELADEVARRLAEAEAAQDTQGI